MNVIESLLNNTATHQRSTQSQNTDGTLKDTWSVITASIKGHLRKLSGYEQYEIKKQNYTANYRFYTTTAGIENGDRLTIDSNVYNVVNVHLLQGITTHYQVDLSFYE